MKKDKKEPVFTLELLNGRGDEDIASNLEQIKAMYPNKIIRLKKTKTKTLYEVIDNDKRK